MLVLSRKQDEEIVIADCIEVKVLRICGNRVRLGITAAQGVRIERPERRGQHHDNRLAAPHEEGV